MKEGFTMKIIRIGVDLENFFHVHAAILQNAVNIGVVAD
jgi:hypothetical protein